MRTFIGLDFDKELKSKIESIQSIVKRYSHKGSWVEKDNFHTTLKFLGETGRNEIVETGRILDILSKKYPPINLSLNHLGYFNRRKDKIGVLWLGFAGELEELNRIYNEIENSMVELGFPKEKRKFKPHITLGRRIVLKKPFNELKKILHKEIKYKSTIDTISLFGSEQVMRKRVYIPIKSKKFVRPTAK